MKYLRYLSEFRDQYLTGESLAKSARVFVLFSLIGFINKSPITSSIVGVFKSYPDAHDLNDEFIISKQLMIELMKTVLRVLVSVDDS